jgi:hypothetical protein
MAELPAVIKQDAYPDELVWGECIVYVRNDKDGNLISRGLIICCPKCNKTSTGPHTYNPETLTLHPSIVCNSITDEGQKCTYHGWLINGIFSEV